MAGEGKPREYRGLGGGQTWVSEEHGSQLEQTTGHCGHETKQEAGYGRGPGGHF